MLRDWAADFVILKLPRSLMPAPLCLYPSDLSDREWALLEPLLPSAKPGGRPRSVNLRRILNGVFYLLRTGCPWRYLPRDYGPWSTVFHYFRLWRTAGLWERIQALLRERARQALAREPTPSAAIIDSQSVKTTEQGGPHGYDGGKKVNGRKRHILVDTLGLLLKVVVHPASIQDRDGAKLVLAGLKERFPRLRHLWTDQAYTGPILEWIKEQLGWTVEVVERSPRRGFLVTPGGEFQRVTLPAVFEPLPRRWVVERSLAWTSRYRRMSKDYERLPSTSEAFVYLTGIRLLLGRLTRGEE
jgi:putative transposase